MRIALVAGEASGDLLGAELLAALKRRHPAAQFAGVGGPALRAAGLEAWHDAAELAVMGLTEVLRHLPRLLALRRRLIARLLAWRPTLYVGIDAPDFNLGVERRLKRAGIATAHYVSPSVWAWRERRAARIGRSATRVLCLFPMEPPIYARHGVDAEFVGHPLADRFALEPDRAAARRALGLAPDARVLALLPGSRLGEIARLGPAFLETARRVLAARPGTVVVAPMASAACRAAFEAIGARAAPLALLDGRAHEAMVAADAVLLASGTAALEAMLAKRPMVVGYKLAPLSYWIVTTFGLMRTTRYALPNVLAGEDLVPELMQHRCTPAALTAATLAALDDTAGAERLAARFAALHRSLGGAGAEPAAERAARALEPLLAGA